MSKRFFMMAISLLLIGVVAAGCRESSQTVSAENVQIAVEIADEDLAIGEATLLVTVSDDDNNPIENASVSARGDMNHAGMVPVISAPITENENGVYSIPFAWSMGGDWIVIVTVTMPDETIAEQEFNYVVSGSGPVDMNMDITEEPEMDMEMTEEAGS